MKNEKMYKRTNIELDIDLVNEVMAIYKLKSIKEAVHLSLQKTIEQQKRKKLLAMEGKIEWEGNLDEMRS
ncbi:MAG: type II toxin-antitoxin system VapB family antitoxin [Draconibacterium sp.]